MGEFRQFMEALRFDNQFALDQLGKHPLYQQSTFGMEVEFLAYNAAVEDDPETFFDPRDDEGESIDPDDIAEEAEDRFFPQIQAICSKHGYHVFQDKNAGRDTFAFGADGSDATFMLPVLELRTCPLPVEEKELARFQAFLTSISEFVKANHDEARFMNNTGLHIHVSNPALAQDTFSKLSTLANVDEDKIWDDMATHDRDFERFALLNKHQNYEGFNAKGVHQKLVGMFAYGNATKYWTDATLKKEITARIGRNIGVNATTEQPTVEYRYLSSAILGEKTGPQKVIDYIKYFAKQAVSRTAKTQFAIHDDDDNKVVFTRQKDGMIRIDYITDKETKVAQPGWKAADLRQKGPDPLMLKKPEVMGYSQWRRNAPVGYASHISQKLNR